MVRILLLSIDNCENLPILNTELPLLTFYHTSNIDSEMINAVKINDTTLFKCLLQSGANLNAIDSKGNSALTYAAGIGNFEIIQHLIENENVQQFKNINGELVSKVTNVSWGVIFPLVDMMPRHPSQLYEALLEGLILFLILNSFFTKSQNLHAVFKLSSNKIIQIALKSVIVYCRSL